MFVFPATIRNWTTVYQIILPTSFCLILHKLTTTPICQEFLINSQDTTYLFFSMTDRDLSFCSYNSQTTARQVPLQNNPIRDLSWCHHFHNFASIWTKNIVNMNKHVNLDEKMCVACATSDNGATWCSSELSFLHSFSLPIVLSIMSASDPSTDCLIATDKPPWRMQLVPNLRTSGRPAALPAHPCRFF